MGVRGVRGLGSILLLFFCFADSTQADLLEPKLPALPRTFAAEKLCKEFLRSRSELFARKKVEGSEGLYVLRGARFSGEPHEKLSLIKYADFIFSMHGETVLALPSLGKHATPGFDGVVYNSEKTPVANLSVKSVQGNSPYGAAMAAIKKALPFSRFIHWMYSYSFLKNENGVLDKPSRHENNRYDKRKDWLFKVLNIFGLNQTDLPYRPARIVVDIQSGCDFPNQRGRNALRRQIVESNGFIESILFFRENQYLLIRRK